jgi:hypothetical protein
MSDTAKERALAELKEEKDREAMGKAYDEAASRSMGTFKEKAPKPPTPASAASSPAKSKVMTKAKGGCTKMAKGGVTRADGCAQRGKTKGRMV